MYFQCTKQNQRLELVYFDKQLNQLQKVRFTTFHSLTLCTLCLSFLLRSEHFAPQVMSHLFKATTFERPLVEPQSRCKNCLSVDGGATTPSLSSYFLVFYSSLLCQPTHPPVQPASQPRNRLSALPLTPAYLYSENCHLL